jgi:predicted Fe-Mo cluster-binding NifX family protein
MAVALKRVMKIAISHWQGRISPVFDVAQQVLLVDLDSNQVVRRQHVSLGPGDPFCRAKEIVGLGAELLVCGAISHPLEKALAQAGVRVAGFTCGDVDTILAALQTGRLGEACFRMPGAAGPAVNGWGRRHGAVWSGGRRKRIHRTRRGPGRTANSTLFNGSADQNDSTTDPAAREKMRGEGE